MNDYTPYIKELVKANLELLVDDNEKEIVRYLSSKGYHFTRPAKEVRDIYTFDNAWNLYSKKVGSKARLNKKWNSLSLEDRKAATEYIPLYVLATPDKQYRKNFQTFLNNRSWEDEIIVGHAPAPVTIENEDVKPIGERWKEAQHVQADTSDVKLRTRIDGMMRLLQINPKSLCRGQMESYYADGTLRRLGISWAPDM